MSQLKHGFRQLALRPGLSATVIAMLALGIGATTAIYSLIHQAILEPMQGIYEPDELASVTATGPRFGSTRGGLAVGGGAAYLFSYPMFRDLQAQQRSFSGLAGHYDFLANVSRRDETSLLRGVLVSGDYFSVLNVQPALGRLIGPQDAPRVGESRVVVLDHQYWQNRFGGDPSVVGETLDVNGQPLTIIGVAPEEFGGMMRGWNPRVYVPITLRWLMQPEEPRNDENRQAYWVYLFGRLNPGVSIEQAQADLDGLYRSLLTSVEAPRLTGLSAQQREQYLGGRIVLEPGARGQRYVDITTQPALVIALGATLFVLLIVCVNVANLLLARGASRAGEMAIRASIGAGRFRLVNQLVTESFVLALIGGALSLPVAIVTLRAIAVLIPQVAGSGWFGVTLSAEVAVFAAGLTLVTVLLFGLVPALTTGRADPARVIKAQSAQSPGGRGLTRFRSTLVGLQIALSVVLLVLAGLFARSLVNVSGVDLGMDAEPVAVFSVTPVLSGASGARLDAVYDRVEEAVAALPGVESVASVAFPMFYGFDSFARVTVVGAQEQPEDAGAQANMMISPGFFETLSIPLLAGRDFRDTDSAGSPTVAIVNESFVRKFELGDDAIGTVLRLEENPYVPRDAVEIIGVVGDARYTRVKGEMQPQVFTPRPEGDASFNSLFFYVRGGLDSDVTLGMIPPAIERIDPNLPVSNMNTVRNQIDSSADGDRLMTVLSAVFAGLATVLAAIGLYGVLAFNVTQRQRELGLRMALGASPIGLRRLVLGEVGKVAGLGGFVGLVAAVGAGRAAESMLFGLAGYDAFALVTAAAVMTAVVLVATFVPALRASRVEPMEALRYE